MNKVIKKFGEVVYNTVETHPKRAQKLLRTAFSLAGAGARYLPSKHLIPARQYIAHESAGMMARSLKDTGNAALVNIFLPCEILHAMGIDVMFPEGLSCFVAAADSERAFVEAAEKNGVPESLCSYHKVVIGLAETGVMPKPAFVITTTLACDANQLSFRRIAAHYDIPHFMIDVPYECGEGATRYVAAQLREMTAFVEKHSGRKLDEDSLKASIARSRRTIDNYRAYLELRAARYVADEMTSEMNAVFATHVLLGTPQAEKYTQMLAENVRKLPGETRGKRLLWVHTLPFWEDSLKEIFNANDRCEVIACDMTFDSLSDMDESDPYISMSRRLVECSFNGPAVRRMNLVADTAKKMHADAVIYFCHWGCKQTLGVSRNAKTFFENRGLPTLVIDGDGCDKANMNDGQTLTRVQAFIEQLEGKA